MFQVGQCLKLTAQASGPWWYSWASSRSQSVNPEGRRFFGKWGAVTVGLLKKWVWVNCKAITIEKDGIRGYLMGKWHVIHFYENLCSVEYIEQCQALKFRVPVLGEREASWE